MTVICLSIATEVVEAKKLDWKLLVSSLKELAPEKEKKTYKEFFKEQLLVLSSWEFDLVGSSLALWKRLTFLLLPALDFSILFLGYFFDFFEFLLGELQSREQVGSEITGIPTAIFRFLSIGCDVGLVKFSNFYPCFKFLFSPIDWKLLTLSIIVTVYSHFWKSKSSRDAILHWGTWRQQTVCWGGD
eukprot:TRINITY_DN3161_c0_g2_i10.p1 TRINITY_DN3161_c0_g2~~TRINITY_DN3161_c0_g2_i10.p1  ORF type:complete len:187 (-),score=32.70 TRINITY_DN3161_c0_g2_i10:240-800(-)